MLSQDRSSGKRVGHLRKSHIGRVQKTEEQCATFEEETSRVVWRLVEQRSSDESLDESRNLLYDEHRLITPQYLILPSDCRLDLRVEARGYCGVLWKTLVLVPSFHLLEVDRVLLRFVAFGVIEFRHHCGFDG